MKTNVRRATTKSRKPTARPQAARSVEVWTLSKPPIATREESRRLSFKTFQQRVVAAMTATAEAKRAEYDPNQTVLLLGAKNEIQGTERVDSAIDAGKPFIIVGLRPDLICVDLDNVPRSAVRRFVRQHLARGARYVLVPSGGRATRLPERRAMLHRYHLFVLTETRTKSEEVRSAAKALGREMKRRSKDEGWPVKRLEVVLRRAIRGPLFAHRFFSRTKRLRDYCSKYPGVLPAIVEVLDRRCEWNEDELTAEVTQRELDVPAMPTDAESALSAGASRHLLELLDAHQSAGDIDNWSASFRLVNRLDASGFTAAQTWGNRNHPSLAFVILGPYKKPISESAAWSALSRMFADAAKTRPSSVRGAPPLRDEILAAAVLTLQKSTFKLLVAALVVEREETMRVPRSKRTFGRCVAIGQRALGELANIASPATVTAALRALEDEGWIVWGPRQAVGTPRPFAVTLPRSARSKLNNWREFSSRCRDGRDGVADASEAGRSKPIHDIQLPPSRRDEEDSTEVNSTRARVDVRTLRALLKAHAFRVRGYPASALQYILSLLLRIDRQDLPVAESTLRRMITALREDDVLAENGRLSPNFLDVLEVNAVERHQVEAADRQKERNHKQRVSFIVKQMMALRTSRARRQRLRRLRDRNSALAEAVVQDLEAAHGPRWYAVGVS